MKCLTCDILSLLLQAFLEMEDQDSAVGMVNYFTNCTATLRDRSVYVQFSTHTELKTDQTHSNASASAQAALQAAQALTGAGDSTMAAGRFINGAQNARVMPGGGSNTVLRVVVDHMVYPVTLDVIYQIFSRVGKVLKIVTFTKNNTFQVLIQYPDVVTAQAAKLSLDGQNIYNGCCTLRIEYSKLSNLNVKYNNDKSRDYTNPALPSGDQGLDVLQHDVFGNQLHGLTNPMAFGNPALAGYSLGSMASSALAQAGLRFPPAVLASSLSAAGLSAAGLTANGVQGLSALKSGSVLLVSNLNEEATDCDHLFTLFGVFGDVHRVKILYNKKDTALIQMAEAQQAVQVMACATLFTNPI